MVDIDQEDGNLQQHHEVCHAEAHNKQVAGCAYCSKARIILLSLKNQILNVCVRQRVVGRNSIFKSNLTQD